MLQLAGCAWRSQLHFEVCYTVILIHVLVLKTTFLNAALLFLSAVLKSDFPINWLLLRKKKDHGSATPTSGIKMKDMPCKPKFSTKLKQNGLQMVPSIGYSDYY